jgi:hypothetical protein
MTGNKYLVQTFGDAGQLQEFLNDTINVFRLMHLVDSGEFGYTAVFERYHYSVGRNQQLTANNAQVGDVL